MYVNFNKLTLMAPECQTIKVFFTLNIHETTRGLGSWKLNISHLENKNYQIDIQNIYTKKSKI